jgi:hypothetical protein
MVQSKSSNLEFQISHFKSQISNVRFKMRLLKLRVINVEPGIRNENQKHKIGNIQ